MAAKSVRILYYALLREERGMGAETLETEAETTGALYAELRMRHNFRLPQSSMQVAVDDQFAGWEAPLKDGAKVVFIPPVAGG